MLNFKSLLISKELSISLFLSLSMIACTPGKPQKGDASDLEASFFVSKSNLEARPSQEISHSIFPQYRFLQFESCLKDNQFSKNLENQKFTILNSDKTQALFNDLISDKEGCLRWTEKFNFNYLASGKWHLLERIVEAHGIQRGQIKLSYLINLWENTYESLFKKNMVVEGVSPFTSEMAMAKSDARIFFENLDLNIQEQSIGKKLSIKLLSQAEIELSKTPEKRIREPMPRGNFEIQLRLLVEENNPKKLTELGQSQTVKGSVTSGTLRLDDNLILDLEKNCSQGNTYAEVLFNPLDKEISDFKEKVLYRIGACDTLSGNLRGQIEKKDNEKTPAVIKSTEPKKEIKASEETRPENSSQRTANVDPQASSIVKDISFINQGTGGVSSEQGVVNPSKRMRKFTVKACLINPTTKKPLIESQIEVYKINGIRENKKTLQDGCFSWEDSIKFDLFETECWTRHKSQIKVVGSNLSEEITFDINAWLEGFGSIRDARVNPLQLTCQDSKSEISLSNFEMESQINGLKYSINKKLNLLVEKTFLFKLNPRLIKNTQASSNGLQESNLPPGTYKIRYAVADSRLKNITTQPIAEIEKSLLQWEEKEVTVASNGILQTSLTIKNAETRNIGLTNYLMIELEPTVNSAVFVPKTFVGNLLSTQKETHGNLIILSNQKYILKDLKSSFEKTKNDMDQKNSEITSFETAAQIKSADLNIITTSNPQHPFLRALSTPTLWRQSPHSPLQNALPYPADKLRSQVANGKIDKDLQDRICGYIFLYKAGKEFPEFKNNFSFNYNLCRNSLNGGHSWLSTRQLFFVDELSIKSMGPLFQDIKTLNTGWSIGYGKDRTKTFSADVNAGIVGSKLIPSVFEAVSPLSIGGGVRYQWAWSQRNSEGVSTSWQTSKQIGVDHLPFNLEVSKYKVCLLSQLSTTNTTIDIKLMTRSPQGLKLLKEFFQPIMICSDESFQIKKQFTEKYSIFHSISNGDYAIDSNSSDGRPFFMMLRNQDYQRFLRTSGDKIDRPSDETTEHFVKNEVESLMSEVFNYSKMNIPGVFESTEDSEFHTKK